MVGYAKRSEAIGSGARAHPRRRAEIRALRPISQDASGRPAAPLDPLAGSEKLVLICPPRPSRVATALVVS